MRRYYLFGYNVWPPVPRGFKLNQTFYYITYEPLAFLLYTGLYLLITVQPTLQKIRFTNTYQEEWLDTSDSNAGNASLKDFENAMQTYLIHWNQYRLLANLPFAMFVAIFFGSWSDHSGRKFNVMAGIAALMIGYTFAQSLLYSYTVQFPLWTWIAFTFVEGCLGNQQLAFFAGQAYQADLCQDKDELVIRMNITSLMRGLGAVAGTYLTLWLALDVGDVMWCTVGNTIAFVGFIYAVAFMEHIPPKQLEIARRNYAVQVAGERERVTSILEDGRRMTVRADSNKLGSVDSLESSFNWKEELISLAKEFKAAWHVFARPRTGYKRGCIWVLTVVGFISNCVGQEAALLVATYLEFTYEWTQEEYAKWSGNGLVVSSVGQIVGILLMKKVLKMRDTWVLMVSLLSLGVGAVPIAFHTETALYLSNYISVFGQIVTPTLSSLITHFVEPEEVGRVILGIAVMLLVAIVVQTYVLQEIYVATLKWFPGFMFLLVAGLTCACCFGVAWVDFVEKPKPFEYDVNEIVEDELADEEASKRKTSRAH